MSKKDYPASGAFVSHYLVTLCEDLETEEAVATELYDLREESDDLASAPIDRSTINRWKNGASAPKTAHAALLIRLWAASPGIREIPGGADALHAALRFLGQRETVLRHWHLHEVVPQLAVPFLEALYPSDRADRRDLDIDRPGGPSARGATLSFTDSDLGEVDLRNVEIEDGSTFRIDRIKSARFRANNVRTGTPPRRADREE